MADLAEARAVARAKAGAICQSKFAQRARYTRAKRRAAGRMFRRHDLFPGGYRGRVPPVPIPNTEVKPATADGTARATVWESRSLPGLFLQGRVPQARGLFFFERVCFFQWRGAHPRAICHASGLAYARPSRCSPPRQRIRERTVKHLSLRANSHRPLQIGESSDELRGHLDESGLRQHRDPAELRMMPAEP